MSVTVTAPAGFDQTIITLIQSFDAVCAGSDVTTFQALEAASNFLIASINHHGTAEADACGCGNARKHAIQIAENFGRDLAEFVAQQWEPVPADSVEARRN